MEVKLHVYDLTKQLNDKFWKFGLGIFHSGVEVGGKEYWYFGHEYNFTGVIILEPGITVIGNMIKRNSYSLGYTKLTGTEIQQILDNLTNSYKGNTYHPIKRNCNHFSQEFCKSLLGKNIPKFINRAAFFASCILRFVSEDWIWWALTKLLPSDSAQDEHRDQNETVTNHVEKEEKQPLRRTSSPETQTETQTEDISLEDPTVPQPQTVEEIFLQSLNTAPAAKQREVATWIFNEVNHGQVQFDDIV